ncbi:flagellar hook-basal body complex protein FliE [Bacillus sp. BGMRC 2118]|nr:flagellar hook-basal body complex protein FliE [Bacillus sp. BGMRC 2118]
MINSVSNSLKVLPTTTEPMKIAPAESQKKFAAFLSDSLNKVNETAIQSDVATEKLAAGEKIDLHEVMIASQKASITLQTTLEIRNKVIEAYQEVMRMQV